MNNIKKERADSVADSISIANNIIKDKIKFVKGNIDKALEILRSIDNEKLLSAVMDLIESRYYLKKPMTPLAIKMLLNRLNTIYNNKADNNLKIATLEKAIACCWLTVYPLSADEQHRLVKNKKNTSYSIDDIKKKMNNFD